MKHVRARHLWVWIAAGGLAAGCGDDACPTEVPAPRAACSTTRQCGPYADALHADCVARCPPGCTGGGAYGASIAATAECRDGEWGLSPAGDTSNVCTVTPRCSCPNGGAGGHKSTAADGGEDAGP